MGKGYWSTQKTLNLKMRQMDLWGRYSLQSVVVGLSAQIHQVTSLQARSQVLRDRYQKFLVTT